MLGTGEGRGGNTHYTSPWLNIWQADKPHSRNVALKPRRATTSCIQHNSEAAKKRAQKEGRKTRDEAQVNTVLSTERI
ncbi:hypothetical protein E2C01_059244 [Portunus trituberculatus]|uniref:Uncharacterized protein n=1 Tax=Portunus trituberculatus TaxID=210409 RepID=A0A5B7H5B4_PORTR|nr:hypothetical protein [Portunus trituberculatus]